jgi:WD40 repeat protein
LQIFDLATAKGGEQVQLPDAALGYVRIAAVSPDLGYLAVSQRSRGAVWNLQTGQRLYHVRSFQGAYFSSDGELYADFPKEDEIDRSLAKLSLGATDIERMHSFDKAERTREVGRYLLTLVTPQSTHSSPGASGRSSVGIGSVSRMEVRDVRNQSLLWTKDFVAGLGAYWVSADTNTLVLCWPANSNSFDAITKQDSELASRIARYPSREGIDWMQVFDLDTGKAKGNVFIDTGKGSFSPIQVQATSNSLIVSDNKKRVLLYSMSGQIEGTIAGHSPVVSLPSQLITVLTEGRALELYELPSLKRRSVYEFNSPVSLSDFSEDGKRLLVLTSDQTVYTLDVRNPPY